MSLPHPLIEVVEVDVVVVVDEVEKVVVEEVIVEVVVEALEELPPLHFLANPPLWMTRTPFLLWVESKIIKKYNEFYLILFSKKVGGGGVEG